MPYDTIYLSVLGDINGDGRITASDVSYLRQVANDNTLLENMPIEKKLACMINNKGGITEVDSEILRNYIGKEIDLEKFLESETANTNNTYTYLTLDRGRRRGNIPIGTRRPNRRRKNKRGRYILLKSNSSK